MFTIAILIAIAALALPSTGAFIHRDVKRFFFFFWQIFFFFFFFLFCGWSERVCCGFLFLCTAVLTEAEMALEKRTAEAVELVEEVEDVEALAAKDQKKLDKLNDDLDDLEDDKDEDKLKKKCKKFSPRTRPTRSKCKD
jgi:uncharacterized protein YlxW (UPF0749 family)